MPLSGRRDSNPLPTAWEAVALPGELLPLMFLEAIVPTSRDYFRINLIYETVFGNEIFFTSQLSFAGMIQLFSNSSFVNTTIIKEQSIGSNKSLFNGIF